MLKRLLYITTIFFSCFTSYGQYYGNEWIDYSQKYYKFPVYTTGLYRIDYNFLISNSIPVSGISSSQFQIFGRDKEVPLYMVDNGDNSFDPGDYFLFVGDKNDGWLDSVQFFDPSRMANPGYSLISDTNYYYFSWKNSGNGLRYQTEPDQNFSTYTPAPYVISHSVIADAGMYIEGKVEDHASGSIYANGEGYGNAEVVATSSNSQTSVNFSTPQVYTGIGGQKPKVHCRVTSNSNATVLGSLLNNHHLRLNFGSASLLFEDTVFSGYQQIISNAEFQPTDLSNGTTPLFYEAVANIESSVDRLVLTYATLSYARNPHASFLTSDRFLVRNKVGESKVRVDLSALGGNPIVFGYGSQNTAVLPVNSSGVWQFNLPENTSGIETDVRIFDQTNPIIPISLVSIDADAQFTDFTGVNIDSALIFVYPNAFKTAAENYRDYRTSLQGGGYNVIMISSEEIYHHFGGGVQNGPVGIRRFVDYIYDQSIQKPVGLFLLGKGVSPYYLRQNPSALANNFVPTFGFPSSDNALLSYLNGSKWDPLIPVGRISVNTNADLENYLSKVQEYEALQDQSISSFVETKDWQKQILHFVGGSDAIQQTNFQGFMNSMKSIAEDTLFAGNVTSYFKTTSAPLDPNVVAGVTEKIENGVSIMNFFGHASTTNNGFEINVDEPLNWNNTGKYPIVIGNSCYNGDIYLPGFGVTSERFVNLPQEGAIAFISSVGVGYDVPLYIYSSELYRQFSYRNYGETFGYQIKKTIEYLQNIYSISTGPGFNLIYEAMCSQMVLNGDPLLRVNYNTNPEIHVTNSDLSLSPANVNLNTDSLYLTIRIKNLGKSVNQALQVEIKRDFPGTNIDSVYTITLDSLNYDYTLVKSFPLQAQIAAGINTFTVSVDIPSFIDEQFEEFTNNTATANFFLNIDGINPIWPYNYAVVPYDTITVKASTIN
ncbi:MAG: C25 family cysteine peptidase, partial [Fluviicola sp.]